ncbi:hypothetical protein MKK88_05730 [Methylobacterium sp. E-005]|uniref:hypothetical protein n=1 Tax=Methylobacterium sp. E-005 TaxID=2836549 RepID=UPI001FB932FE|nr:hypothetical protein [Methylobacterium sp. E-005]MCJ2085494.1 hypothetical protein [Methylobacterium sp. E-005]
MTIQNARSNTSGNVPPSLQDGQIAVNQADGVLFTRNPDGTIRRTLLPKRYGVADAAFTVRVFDTYVGLSSLTASRAIVLPAAAAYPAGQPLTIADEAGACTPTVFATITAAGSDKINGVATYNMTQGFLGIILFSDGVSKWTAIALPGSGASNAVLYVAQALTAGQQDQARLNVSGAIAATPTATTTLAVLDFARDQFVTGTSTLTMPGASPGWISGIVTNDNAASGLVTLAVPSGHSLDGALNGSLTLYPRQRARLRLVNAGTWRSDWIDRSPVIAKIIVAASIASVDIPLPVGYPSFEYSIVNLSVDAAQAVYMRLSYDGSTFLSSTGSYFSEVIQGSNTRGSGTAALTYYGANAQIELFGNLATNNANNTARGLLSPGTSSSVSIDIHSAAHFDNTGGINNANYIHTGGTGRAQIARIYSAANILPGTIITFRGMP